MMNDQCSTSAMGQHDGKGCYRKCISWSAILVGALVGIGLTFLLNIFSIAIGLSLVTTNKEGMMTLAIGGFIGLAIATIAPMFVAGYAAGYLGRNYCDKRNLGVVYGFSAWCVALILTVLLASNMGHYVTVYSNFVSHPTAVVVTETESPAMNATIHNTMHAATTNQAVSPQTEQAANTLGMSTFLVFILFFISAVSSAFGGHFGMCCCSKKYCDTTANR